MTNQDAIWICALVVRVFGVQLVVVASVISLLFLIAKFGRNRNVDHVHYSISLAPGFVWIALTLFAAGVFLLIGSGPIAHALIWNLPVETSR